MYMAVTSNLPCCSSDVLVARVDHIDSITGSRSPLFGGWGQFLTDEEVCFVIRELCILTSEWAMSYWLVGAVLDVFTCPHPTFYQRDYRPYFVFANRRPSRYPSEFYRNEFINASNWEPRVTDIPWTSIKTFPYIKSLTQECSCTHFRGRKLRSESGGCYRGVHKLFGCEPM